MWIMRKIKGTLIFNKYVLSAYYVPVTVVAVQDSPTRKTDKDPFPCGSYFQQEALVWATNWVELLCLFLGWGMLRKKEGLEGIKSSILAICKYLWDPQWRILVVSWVWISEAKFEEYLQIEE